MELAVSGHASQDEIGSALDDLDWYQFEKLIFALFRAQGHTVEMRGGANADGGIDLVLGSGSERTAVQCKHWGSWKCAPKVVRELLGAMTHEGFAQGMLVCRRATPAAHSLASQERITIIERDGVIQRVSQAMATENTQVRSLLFTPEKLCPKCGAPMVRRTASKGSNVGSEFWGCSKYPECRQTMRV
jgi:restriction system protein